MSNAAVVERRNKQVQDALDSGNLKQALQLCEKRIKKGETSHFLLAWKANILCAHHDAASQKRGIQESLDTCRAEPPITDLDTIELLTESLKLDSQYKTPIDSLWERAARAKPLDLEIQLRWFSNAIDAEDWKTAQKAAMSLQHNFPNERSYFFSAIFLCYVIAIAQDSSEADRKLFGTLAYRMIAKAASMVPSDPEKLTSQPKAIQTPEELLLLVNIYETQGRFVEIAETLNSKTLGTDSQVAQGDWTFVQERIRNLRKAKLWEELLRTTTKDLLALPEDNSDSTFFDPGERDDWEVWQGLLKATREQLTQTFQSSFDFVKSYISKRPRSRNARLCLLGLVEMAVPNGLMQSSDLIEYCQRYIDENGHKLYCFYDIYDVVGRLNPDERKAVMDYVSGLSCEDTKSEGIFAINCLKLKYSYSLSFDKTSPQEVDEFVKTCLRLYRALERPTKTDGVIESQPRDDLCVMAAMTLIKFHKGSPSPNQPPPPAFIQAAAILIHLLVGSPHNYEALLLLTRIYLLLGAGSLALATFGQLNVKQMQYESVAHNLFTRLATVHPHSAPPGEALEPKDYDPQLAFRLALDFYRRSDRATASAVMKGLQYGSYMNTRGTIRLRDALRRSICQRMWALEERRVHRLLGGSPNTRYDHIAFDQSPVVDQRDYQGFMDLEALQQPPFEAYIQIGPHIRAEGLKSFSLVDTLFYLLTGPKATQDKDAPKPDPSSFNDFAANIPVDQLTTTEVDNSKIHCALLKGVLGLSNGPSGTADVQTAVKEASEWIKEKITQFSEEDYLSKQGIKLSDTTTVPSWIYMHSSISCFETLSATHIFLQRVSKSKHAKVSKEEQDSLKLRVLQLLEVIRANTKRLKSQVTKPGILGEVIAACTGGSEMLQKEIGELIDEAELEASAGSLLESWEEALDGVNSIAML